MGGYSWQHLFPELYGAGSSTLPCSSQDLDRVLDAFERDIPYIKTNAQVTLAIERLRSKIPVAISCILYDKNEYAEVVRVRQLIDDLVEAYFKVLQVQAASSSAVPTTADFFFGELASVYEKLPSLHQGATSKVEAFNAYKNSMTYIGALLNHFGTAGKCALGVLVTHDVFSERIANASSPEEARWEQIKMVISDVTLTGGCLAAGNKHRLQLRTNPHEPDGEVHDQLRKSSRAPSCAARVQLHGDAARPSATDRKRESCQELYQEVRTEDGGGVQLPVQGGGRSEVPGSC